MYKSIIVMFLLVIGSMGFVHTSASEKDADLTPASTFTSVRNLPVIVKNEAIAKNICRLSFENGTSRDVPCDTEKTFPEAVATK